MLLDPILFHVPCPIFWKGLDGAFLGCNKLFLAISGFSDQDELIGKKDPELPWKQYSNEYAKDDQYVISTGKTITRTENIPIEGRIISSETTKSPLIQNGKIIGVVGICLDITDRKEAEQLRIEVSEQKSKVASMLAAGIAHELRTPLAAINMLAGEADDIMGKLVNTYKKAAAQDLAEGNLQPRQLENAMTIGHELRRTAQSANIFINMMLMKVNLEQPKSAKLTELSARKAVNEAVSLYPLRGGDIILLEWNANENEDFHFVGDATLFNHILFNLFKNALHHLKAAQKGKITIWLESGKKHNFLHFKDTGPGIPTEIMPHIFDVFYSKTAHGTGVGLALCKMIMTEFGGKISCDSILGEYTHFTLEFPKLR